MTIEERVPTVEERAKNAWVNNGLRGSYMLGYIEGATEQDRIARKEERERCIKAMQKWHCEKRCSFFQRLQTCPMCDKWNCHETEQIRKEIEKGG